MYILFLQVFERTIRFSFSFRKWWILTDFVSLSHDMWMSNGKALLKTPMVKVIQPYEVWCYVQCGAKLKVTSHKQKKQDISDVSEGLFRTKALGVNFWKGPYFLVEISVLPDHFGWGFQYFPCMNYTWTHWLSWFLMLRTTNFWII